MFDPAVFRETLGHFPTGVVVITAIDDAGEPAGMVVGSFTSVSLDPPLVAYLPMRTSGSYQRLRTSAHFCVNILAADQQDLCGRFASRVADKFAGVDWRPAPSGAPILPGVIGWIDCEVDQEVEGGDHMVVMGKVLDLAVERPTLPLLFFQGGFGRFALSSTVTADPELIESARLAECVRGPLEELAAELGADSNVMARVGQEAVFVAASHASDEPGGPSVGHRIPLIPPVGTVFCAQAPDDEVDRWMQRARATDEEREQFRTILDRVRTRGYSLTLSPEDPAERLTRMHEYSSTDVLPMHERRVREMIAGSAALYEPELEPGQTYDLHSVIVPLPTEEPQTRLAVRLSRLPHGATVEQVQGWIDALGRVAAEGADRLQRRACAR